MKYTDIIKHSKFRIYYFTLQPVLNDIHVGTPEFNAGFTNLLFNRQVFVTAYAKMGLRIRLTYHVGANTISPFRGRIGRFVENKHGTFLRIIKITPLAYL